MQTELFDHEGALERLGGDEQLFQELAQFFLEDAPGLLDQVKEGLRASDCETVERSAHSLKGLAGNFGAMRSREAAYAMERFGRERDLAGAANGLARLEDEIELLKQALAPFAASASG